MRTLIACGCALACMAAIAADDAEPGNGSRFEMVEIAEGNFVHFGVHDERAPANLGDNANIGFIVGERCVLVVDSGGSRPVGEALADALRAVTDLPVCHVVITHVHPDHFFGAAAFAGAQPAFIGHENLPRQLAARARTYVNALERDLGDLADGSDIVQPTLTVKSGETLELDLGGRVVAVRAWRPAHTDNDLTVFDRKTATLWLGDLLFVEHTPVLDSNITGFLSVMDELRGLEVDAFVPGHGRASAPWPAALEPQRRYFEMILHETRNAIRDRVSLMDAVHQIGYSEEGNWLHFETYHRRNVTTAYTELEWE